MTKGPTRIMIDSMQRTARYLNITIEQVADFYDAMSVASNTPKDSTGETLAGMTVQGPTRTQ